MKWALVIFGAVVVLGELLERVMEARAAASSEEPAPRPELRAGDDRATSP